MNKFYILATLTFALINQQNAYSASGAVPTSNIWIDVPECHVNAKKYPTPCPVKYRFDTIGFEINYQAGPGYDKCEKVTKLSLSSPSLNINGITLPAQCDKTTGSISFRSGAFVKQTELLPKIPDNDKLRCFLQGKQGGGVIQTNLELDLLLDGTKVPIPGLFGAWSGTLARFPIKILVNYVCAPMSEAIFSGEARPMQPAGIKPAINNTGIKTVNANNPSSSTVINSVTTQSPLAYSSVVVANNATSNTMAPAIGASVTASEVARCKNLYETYVNANKALAAQLDLIANKAKNLVPIFNGKDTAAQSFAYTGVESDLGSQYEKAKTLNGTAKAALDAWLKSGCKTPDKIF